MGVLYCFCHVLTRCEKVCSRSPGLGRFFHSWSRTGQDAIQVLADVYANWVPRDRILTTNLWSLGSTTLKVTGKFLALQEEMGVSMGFLKYGFP